MSNEELVKNITDYIDNEMQSLDEVNVEVDQEYGLVTITSDYYEVRIDFDGYLFEFKTTDDGCYLSNDQLLDITAIRDHQGDIIEAMFGEEEAE